MGDVLKWSNKIFSGGIRTIYTDSRVDRLNHVWTVAQLAFFAILTVSKQFVGEPIKCWAPAQFKGFWVKYTDSICWISNTYFVPMNETISTEIKHREDKELLYYQWVFLILLLLALLFKLPSVLWNRLNDYSGLNLDKIVNMASTVHWETPEKRKQKIKDIIYYFQRWFETYRQYHSNRLYKIKEKLGEMFLFPFAKRTGNYLASLYIFVKILYLVNSICVFFILNGMLHSRYNLYGFDVIDALMEDGEVRELNVFPRVTLCDFQIRQLQNIQRFTVQCVLSINLYTEKIFIYLWFWFFLIAIFNAVDLIRAIYLYAFSRYGHEFVEKHLVISECLKTATDKDRCQKLVKKLKRDGVFVLRMVERNSSPVLVNDMLVELFNDM